MSLLVDYQDLSDLIKKKLVFRYSLPQQFKLLKFHFLTKRKASICGEKSGNYQSVRSPTLITNFLPTN